MYAGVALFTTSWGGSNSDGGASGSRGSNIVLILVVNEFFVLSRHDN